MPPKKRKASGKGGGGKRPKQAPSQSRCQGTRKDGKQCEVAVRLPNEGYCWRHQDQIPSASESEDSPDENDPLGEDGTGKGLGNNAQKSRGGKPGQTSKNPRKLPWKKNPRKVAVKSKKKPGDTSGEDTGDETGEGAENEPMTPDNNTENNTGDGAQEPQTPATKASKTSRYLMARTEGKTKTTYFNQDATLRIDLDVSIDARWTTRLQYYAHIWLEQPGTKERKIGYIDAYKVSKPTVWQEYITDEWIKDWLTADLQAKGAEDETDICLAWPLQALYNAQGQPRREIGEEWGRLLGDGGNELLFIQYLHIYNDFTGHRFARTAMDTFFRQLFILPSWFNFCTPFTTALQPGEIRDRKQDSTKQWDRGAPPGEGEQQRILRVKNTLFEKVYKPMGFAWIAEDQPVPEVLVPTDDNPYPEAEYYWICGRIISRENFAKTDHDRLRKLPKKRQLPATPAPKRSPGSSARTGPGPGKDPRVLARANLIGQLRAVEEQVNNPDENAPVRTRPGFPFDVDGLVGKLTTPTDADVAAYREALRVNPGEGPTFWCHTLANDAAPWAFNEPHWLSLINVYATERFNEVPTKDEALQASAARAMAWVLQHMDARRQISFVNFINAHGDTARERREMQLEGARLIRVALDHYDMPFILGNPAPGLSAAASDVQWQQLVEDVERGGDLTQVSMSRV